MYPEAGVLQCFDLHADPHEAVNLAGVDAEAPVGVLLRDLVARLEAMGDPVAGKVALALASAPAGTPLN